MRGGSTTIKKADSGIGIYLVPHNSNSPRARVTVRGSMRQAKWCELADVGPLPGLITFSAGSPAQTRVGSYPESGTKLLKTKTKIGGRKYCSW